MKHKLCFLPLMFFVGYCSAAINFGSKTSAIKLADNTSLHVLSGMNMHVVDGTLIQSRAATITDKNITFSNGVLEVGGSENLLTGDYNPDTSSPRINLAGDHTFNAEPGNTLSDIYVSGIRNKVTGQPVLEGTTGITLNDSSTTLTIAIQSKLNKNIVLNGGTVSLEDDLKLSDGVKFTGGGKVIFGGRQIAFGGADTAWDENIFWDNANDMVLNSKLSVTETWTFAGESHISGNGNILDLTGGGRLWIKNGATLHLRDIKLQGLGTGSIVFEDRSSQIRFSDAQIEMDSDYTVTEGGFYVDGESTVYAKNHTLLFEQRGSMTVDGTCLWYDLLEQENHVLSSESVQPTKKNDLARRFIAYLSDGIIRRVVGGNSGDLVWSGVNYLHDDLWLSPDKRVIVTDDKVVFGRSHSLHFSRTNDGIRLPLIEIEDGKSLTFLNTVLENFSPDHLKLGTDSSITFSDNTTIELATDVDLNMSLTFVGSCVLRGNGHRLTLGTNGRIFVQRDGIYNSTLLLDDIEIKGIRDNRIRCFDHTCKISFMNVKWMQDDNYSFTAGYFDIVGDCRMSGNNTDFLYGTDQTSNILDEGLLFLDMGFTFSYDPMISDNSLINVGDEGKIFMNGATIHASTAGFVINNGTLILDHKNYFISDARNVGQAITFNGYDGVIEVMPDASIELLRGYFDYQIPTP